MESPEEEEFLESEGVALMLGTPRDDAAPGGDGGIAIFDSALDAGGGEATGAGGTLSAAGDCATSAEVDEKLALCETAAGAAALPAGDGGAEGCKTEASEFPVAFAIWNENARFSAVKGSGPSGLAFVGVAAPCGVGLEDQPSSLSPVPGSTAVSPMTILRESSASFGEEEGSGAWAACGSN